MVSVGRKDSRVVSQGKGYKRKQGFQGDYKLRRGGSKIREPAVFAHEVQPVRRHVNGKTAVIPPDNSVSV